MAQPPASFGCDRCCIADASAFAAARRKFPLVARLVDESHFDVRIIACPACGRRFVDVFTERIDWVHGEDPQSTSLFPVTAEEADALCAAGDDLVALIERTAQGRRWLFEDWPSDAPRAARWIDGGFRIGPHD